MYLRLLLGPYEIPHESKMDVCPIIFSTALQPITLAKRAIRIWMMSEISQRRHAIQNVTYEEPIAHLPEVDSTARVEVNIRVDFYTRG